MIVEDALGKQFDSDSRYRRIVSLVPSQTEYIINLIGDNTTYKVLCRTKFCIHPSNKVSDITIVGGTKQIHINKIKALNPDIVICNKEENTQEIVKEIEPHFQVFTTEIISIDSALDYMMRIAKLLDLADNGNKINTQIKQAIIGYQPIEQKKAIYLIWKNPYMAAGGDTFIDKMMYAAGFNNVLHDQMRYPSVTIDEIKALRPNVIFLSSEPYPFEDKHLSEFDKLDITTCVVDGEMFSWYGTRMLKSWKYFKKLSKKFK